MKPPAEEAARIVESLPPEKAQALLEFARWLAQRADDEEWDRRQADPRYAGKLTKMADEATAEFRAGRTEPLDPDKV